MLTLHFVLLILFELFRVLKWKCNWNWLYLIWILFGAIAMGEGRVGGWGICNRILSGGCFASFWISIFPRIVIWCVSWVCEGDCVDVQRKDVARVLCSIPSFALDWHPWMIWNELWNHTESGPKEHLKHSNYNWVNSWKKKTLVVISLWNWIKSPSRSFFLRFGFVVVVAPLLLLSSRKYPQEK